MHASVSREQLAGLGLARANNGFNAPPECAKTIFPSFTYNSHDFCAPYRPISPSFFFLFVCPYLSPSVIWASLAYAMIVLIFPSCPILRCTAT